MFSSETPRPLFAASHLQQSEIAACVKLQKGVRIVSDLSYTLEKVKICCQKFVKNSLNLKCTK